jgi:hypothetical protein
MVCSRSSSRNTYSSEVIKLKYKLYYANGYGQQVYPSRKLFERSEQKRDYFEIYDNLEEAQKKANEFINQFPLMYCLICYEDGQEIEIHVDDESYNKAQIERKKFLYIACKIRKKRMFILNLY